MRLLPTLISLCVAAAMAPAAADESWRLEAQQRIEEIRKTDLTVRVVDAKGTPLPDVPVQAAMVRHAFPWGTCVTANHITGQRPDDIVYRAKLTELFNGAVLENDLKWLAWHGAYGPSFTRERTQAALQWLRGEAFFIRGHCLIWPGWQYLKPWGESLRHDLPQLRKRLLDHIDEMARFTEKYVDEWDVVNEPLHHNEVIEALGDSAMAEWFSQARAALPDSCRLFINEYNIVEPNCILERDAYESLLHTLIAANVPVEGIGFQSHFHEPPDSPIESLKVFDRFARFGLPIAVTEFDVNTNDEARQAAFTGDFMTAAFSHPACSSFFFWGFWEGSHWRPDAALFRKDWSEKPNLHVYRELVFKKWWTDASGVTDENGEFALRAFKGAYRISAGKQEKEVAVLDTETVEITL